MSYTKQVSQQTKKIQKQKFIYLLWRLWNSIQAQICEP